MKALNIAALVLAGVASLVIITAGTVYLVGKYQDRERPFDRAMDKLRKSTRELR